MIILPSVSEVSVERVKRLLNEEPEIQIWNDHQPQFTILSMLSMALRWVSSCFMALAVLSSIAETLIIVVGIIQLTFLSPSRQTRDLFACIQRQHA